MNDYERLSRLINTLDTRETVYVLLQSEPSLKLKADLFRFAKLLGAGVTKDDTKSKLIDKTVSCVIGYRLQQQAIMSVKLTR